MIYFANPCGPAVVDAMTAGLLGLIDTPYQGKTGYVRAAHEGGAVWCADNGAFSDVFDETSWWRWLQAPLQLPYAAACRFATAPDVVGDAAATWERSKPWLHRIRDLGYPVAYVGQNGLRELPWDDFDVLFLGGDDTWKLGVEGRRWTEAALERGVPVHMGRVNSERRWRYAHSIGCSSVDGTYLTFGPARRLPDVLAWQRNLDQPALWTM